MARGWAALLALALAWPAAAWPAAGAATRPLRIVSLDLCSDQFVLALADRGQVAALSKVADDPLLSPLAARAEGLPKHRGTAEEVLLLRADLAVGGGFARRATMELLAKVGVTVLRVPPIPRLADLPPQLERVAKAMGHPDRGAAHAAVIRDRLVGHSVPAGQGASVGVYRPGGTMPGEGTLVADMVRAIGMRLRAGDGNARVAVPLELLVLQPPDLLIIDSRRDDRPAMNQAMLDHPALHRSQRMAVADFPLRYWLCNSPASSEGLEVLEAAIARALPGSRP
ncbi:iron complex transport system substrate-binding protein [Stella humosa]|uniref:Iron complex transport system substrate-binding protein n=1 Tax=Stella humosa TaxID=94 RepID=A0A3N1MCN5_9PROT|nr:ABC transporter substrate-binding protein [Stella humosa]ROQ01481.1 iron complex transport system substrate-binding protein [Stella humosa]BBK31859.1 iron ABC transporter substrate-binding protein [Stella humosa]